MSAFDTVLNMLKKGELDIGATDFKKPQIERDQVRFFVDIPGSREVEFSILGVNSDVVSMNMMPEVLDAVLDQSSRMLHSYCDFENGLSSDDVYHQVVGVIDEDAPEKSWAFSFSSSISEDINHDGGATLFCDLVEGYEASVRLCNKSRSDEIKSAAENTIERLKYSLAKDTKASDHNRFVEFMGHLGSDPAIAPYLSRWLAMELGRKLDDATPLAPTSKPRSPGRL